MKAYKEFNFKTFMKRIIVGVISFLTLSLSFLACSSTSDIYLDQEYRKGSLNNDFVVLPLKSSWVPDATTSNIGGQEEEYFYSSLQPSFSLNTPNKVEIINSDSELESPTFKRTTLKNEKVSIRVNLPPEELLNSFEEQYVYFFESYGFKVNEAQSGGTSYAGHEEITVSYSLYFETEFFLLDKKTRKVISWGKIADKTSIENKKPIYNDYVNLISKVSNRILKEGPFTTR